MVVVVPIGLLVWLAVSAMGGLVGAADVVVSSIVPLAAALMASLIPVAVALMASLLPGAAAPVTFTSMTPMVVAAGSAMGIVIFAATTSASVGIVVTCSIGFVLMMLEVSFTQYIALVSTMVALQECNDNGKRRISCNKTASLSWPTVIVQSLFYNLIYWLNYS